jgi:hypothetical protein
MMEFKFRTGEHRVSTWKTMRDSSNDRLPGARGVFAVLLEPPIVNGTRHFVHLSWQGQNYVLRDYLHGVARKQGDELSLDQVWKAAKVRIPCKGRLRRTVDDHAFWRETLRRLTDEHTQSATPFVTTPPRPLGTAQGRGHIPPSFFEPMPDDFLDAWEGKGS